MELARKQRVNALNAERGRNVEKLPFLCLCITEMFVNRHFYKTVTVRFMSQFMFIKTARLVDLKLCIYFTSEMVGYELLTFSTISLSLFYMLLSFFFVTVKHFAGTVDHMCLSLFKP